MTPEDRAMIEHAWKAHRLAREGRNPILRASTALQVSSALRVIVTRLREIALTHS